MQSKKTEERKNADAVVVSRAITERKVKKVSRLVTISQKINEGLMKTAG